MATHRISRQQVKATFDMIASSPWRVFTAHIVRRTDVYLRYPPRNMTENGALVRAGDHAKLVTEDGQTHPDRGNPSVIYDARNRRYDLREQAANRRPGAKMLLQSAGTLRWVSCINYNRERGNGSQHAAPLTGRGRNYDPLDYDLYPLAGFYSDGVKIQPNGLRMLGRFGQWRPYTQLCMRGVVEFHALGHKWIVTDPPQDGPIQYATEAERDYSRRHVVTTSGMEAAPVGGIPMDEAEFERTMGLV
jgi:hypothetical protein